MIPCLGCLNDSWRLMWAVTLGDDQSQRKRPARIVAEVMILLRKAVTENPELPINPIALLCY